MKTKDYLTRSFLGLVQNYAEEIMKLRFNFIWNNYVWCFMIKKNCQLQWLSQKDWKLDKLDWVSESAKENYFGNYCPLSILADKSIHFFLCHYAHKYPSQSLTGMFYLSFLPQMPTAFLSTQVVTSWNRVQSKAVVANNGRSSSCKQN